MWDGASVARDSLHWTQRVAARPTNSRSEPGRPCEGKELMKAITLYQPYASAIAQGLKHFETRRWNTSYRGPLAIHVAKIQPQWCLSFENVEAARGRFPGQWLPRGAVVCIAELVDVRSTTEVAWQVSDTERLYGDYEPGRWAWELANVRVLVDPVFVRGKQGLWDWPVEIKTLKLKVVAR